MPTEPGKSDAAPTRWLCIHGHFYQPPRENAWLEVVETQDSAYPYHDWNERITAECYAPNASSRILDGRGRITRIVNNYSRISFNFGPTLLSWMERRHPEVYEAILEADRLSIERFSGHGSAMAQVYGHAILPLCNPRDRRTQVLWGVRDFRRRFGRDPEGMWLPETAVDVASLEALAEHGIRFTVLEPAQAARVRPAGRRSWIDLHGAEIDTRRPYRVDLPSGRSIAVFFYNGAVSRAVAFEHLLSEGSTFARRLMEGFGESDGAAQLMHIATDGETFGHHHRHGDMALAWALAHIESKGLARITNYGEFLALHPPTAEVRIRENTSWSCAHGIGRWYEDCGCASEIRAGWHQRWRRPLRDALDWVRDTLAPAYEAAAGKILLDPWAARDDYVELVLDRSPSVLGSFLGRHAGRELNGDERSTALKLLEMQRNALLMYTSCGWFFEELSRIETLQVLQYAARALELAEELFGGRLTDGFVERLALAPSNVDELGNGKGVFVEKVLPARVDLAGLGASIAACTLFDDDDATSLSPGFDVDLLHRDSYDAGEARLILGRIQVGSKITLEKEDVTFGFLHLGDHNLSGGVRRFRDEAAYEQTRSHVAEAFSRADFPEVMRRLDEHFSGATYSMQTLISDARRRLVRRVLESTVRDAETVYERLYSRHTPLIRFLKTLDARTPRTLRYAAELVLNTSIRRLLENEPDSRRLGDLIDQAREGGIHLDADELGFAARAAVERLERTLQEAPEDLDRLRRLDEAARLVRSLPFEVDLGTVQNGYYRLLHATYVAQSKRAATGEASAAAWVALFVGLGETLQVAVDTDDE